MKRINSFKECEVEDCMFTAVSDEEEIEEFNITPVAMIVDKDYKPKNNISFVLAENDEKYLVCGYLICLEKGQTVYTNDDFYKVKKEFHSLFYNPITWKIMDNIPYKEGNDSIIVYTKDSETEDDDAINSRKTIKYWCNNVDLALDIRIYLVEVIEVEELGCYDETLADLKFSGFKILEDGKAEEITIEDFPWGDTFIAHESVVTKWIEQFKKGQEGVYTCDKKYKVSKVDGNYICFTEKEKKKYLKFLKHDEY